MAEENENVTNTDNVTTSAARGNTIASVAIDNTAQGIDVTEASPNDNNSTEVTIHNTTTETFGKKSIFAKIRGSNQEEYLENISIVLLVLSTALVSIGIFLGSFISGAAYIGLAGAALFLPGVIIFLVSQFIEDFKKSD